MADTVFTGRRFGKSTFQHAMAEALLGIGKPVAFAKPTHMEVHKRRGHLTRIETIEYEERGKKYTHIVVDEMAKDNTP